MKLTATILAFYIFAGSLIPGTDFGHFLHIGDLLRHMQLHKLEARQLGKDFSWQEFVYDHFINPDDHQHSEHSDHNDLPFHTIHSSLLLWASESTQLEVSIASLPAFEEQYYLNPFHLSGFHPLFIEPPALV